MQNPKMKKKIQKLDQFPPSTVREEGLLPRRGYT
jgi:hypothetical protein